MNRHRAVPMFPSSEIVIHGDFNAHHGDWLNSDRTNYAWHITQMVSAITGIPDVDGHKRSLLALKPSTDLTYRELANLRRPFFGFDGSLRGPQTK
ncbi:unnamed protein product [Pieris macdunnoughi]|uniref:Endonuclease/exonuclease/phosphatase domain-containing protein n=1 Tax=Pieris macdunnoughi TaxID=345717 RepID=A0A821UA33_9NEOP|nr:unnamed protein product [Pieris macdunnoughi]